MKVIVISILLALSSTFTVHNATVADINGNSVLFDDGHDVWEYVYDDLKAVPEKGTKVTIIFDSKGTHFVLDDSVEYILPSKGNEELK